MPVYKPLCFNFDQDAGAVSETLPAEALLAPQRPAPEVRERCAQRSGAVRRVTGEGWGWLLHRKSKKRYSMILLNVDYLLFLDFI